MPLLDALAYSHERGIVHRDVKPDNILVDRRGVPYLLDFGIAKSPESLSHTMAGAMIGTPAYVSPEQARGGEIDSRSDLYSFGVTLYYVLSGKYPFELTGGVHAVFRRLSEDPLPLSSHRLDVHPALQAVVMRALEREPRDRFATALEMKAALEAYLAEEERRTAVAATVPPVPAPAPRKVWPYLVAAYVLVLCLVAGLYLWRRGGPAGGTPRPADTSPTVPPLPGPESRPETSPAARASPLPSPLEGPSRPTAVPAPRSTPLPPTPIAVQARPVQAPERIPSDDALPAGLPESCVRAMVDVSFTVGVDGLPVGPRVISRDHVECQPFALLVVATWKFRPALDSRGQPVPSRPIAAAIQF